MPCFYFYDVVEAGAGAHMLRLDTTTISAEESLTHIQRFDSDVPDNECANVRVAAIHEYIVGNFHALRPACAIPIVIVRVVVAQPYCLGR